MLAANHNHPTRDKNSRVGFFIQSQLAQTQHMIYLQTLMTWSDIFERFKQFLPTYILVILILVATFLLLYQYMKIRIQRTRDRQERMEALNQPTPNPNPNPNSENV